jgi:hypothetical protein
MFGNKVVTDYFPKVVMVFPRLGPALRHSLTPAVLLVMGATSLAAQSATFTGRVLDAEQGRPLINATVTSPTSGGSARTDSTGRFRLEGLKVGIHRFMVSADGYARGSLALAFSAREVMERDLMLERLVVDAPADSGKRAQSLPTVPITADPALGRRYADFERRKATGRGQYLTRAEIEQGNYMTLQDAMRTLRGIKFACAGSFCTAQMTRAPMGCFPDYVVDERVDNAFGPTIPVRDIQGIEVYTGASDVPGEFAGRNAGCGVVVIWTTSGRAPRRK